MAKIRKSTAQMLKQAGSERSKYEAANESMRRDFENYRALQCDDTNGPRREERKHRKLTERERIRLTAIDRSELMGASYESGLPFEIHHCGDAMPSYIREGCDRRDEDRFRLLRESIDDMTPVQAGIADRVLMGGMRISIPCPREFAVDIAVLFAQKVPAMKHALYDQKQERIIFRVVNEDEARIASEKADI